MKPALDLATMTRGLRELGISEADLRAVEALPLLQANALLSTLKDRAKRNFRRLSKELHPDRNGGDQDKTERFKVLSVVQSEFDRVEIRPRPVVRHVPTPVDPPPVVGVQWINPWGCAIGGLPDAIRIRRRNGV